jgi:hypothetical protein
VSATEARALSERLLAALAAARSGDLEAFDEAHVRLIALDKGGAGRVGLAQAAVLNTVLELRHPDGLDGDDARAVLEHTARTVLPWWPELDVNILLLVLAGSLGVLDPDAEPYPAGALELSRHASVLIADLLGTDGDAGAPVAAAIAEIQRAQTIELP